MADQEPTVPLSREPRQTANVAKTLLPQNLIFEKVTLILSNVSIPTSIQHTLKPLYTNFRASC